MRARVVFVLNLPKACQLLIHKSQHTNVAKPCQLFNLACQRAKFSTWPGNVPKAVPIFQNNISIFEFFSYAFALQILIIFGRHLQNVIKKKPCQLKTFDVAFNGAC